MLREQGIIPADCDLVLRTPPNWMLVILFSVLTLVHLAVAIAAFLHGQWEGYIGLIFACCFFTITLLTFSSQFEVAFLGSQRLIRLRSTVGKLHTERHIPFNRVMGVRLTLSRLSLRRSSRIEVLCESEDINCPPTPFPRQLALCLAMLLQVKLIKVVPEGWDQWGVSR